MCLGGPKGIEGDQRQLLETIITTKHCINYLEKRVYT